MLSQTVSVHYNRSLIGTGKSIVSQTTLHSSIPHFGIRSPFPLGSGTPKHPRKWNSWSISETLHCHTIIQSTQMCSLQTGKYPIEIYWYAVIFAVLSVDPLSPYYNLSFVHRSLSPKSSYVPYWSSSWRALRPLWNTRNCRTRSWSLSQILRDATTSETRVRKSWYKFFHPRNPP